MKICIGPISLLEEIPRSLKINDNSLILSKDTNGEIKLFSTICPHQGGKVDILDKKILKCPSHCWTFNSNNGKGISNTSHLISYPTIIKNNLIYTEIPEIEFRHSKFSSFSNELPKIHLISHACLLIEWNGFRLLTDPWIEGPAFLGAWELYPPPTIKVNDLPPIDAIWISHEHSDHLHLPTLSLLDKKIPVYVSGADNNRLVKKVKSLNFENVKPVQSYKTITLDKEIKAISFKSESIWNDNILYLQFGNFSILNINDAGFNWQIRKIIPQVDLICSSFSFGASGYPITWTHLNKNKKIKLINQTNLERLQYIKKVCNLLNAKYFLPFASYFTLANSHPYEYHKLMKHNEPKDVAYYLKNSSTKVLDILPGESWDANSGKISFRPNHEKFFQENFKEKILANQKKNIEKDDVFSKKIDIDSKDLIEYFSSFSDSNLARQVGNLSISFSALGVKNNIHFLIRFFNGKVSCEEISHPLKSVQMTMTCPSYIAREIIHNDLSWDEAHIGYWCTFSRNPDTYNVGLWKLFYAPWQAQKNDNNISTGVTSEEFSNIAIADIIEYGGNNVIELMEKYGLYCVGCNTSMAETIRDGCFIHGVSRKKMSYLVEDLKKILRNKDKILN